MRLWQRVVLDMLLFMAISGFLPSIFHVSSVLIALIASVVLAVLNTLVKPFLSIISLPITILTLGLFSVVINAIMLQLTAYFVGNSFVFSSFGASILVAVILSIGNGLFNRNTVTY